MKNVTTLVTIPSKFAPEVSIFNFSKISSSATLFCEGEKTYSFLVKINLRFKHDSIYLGYKGVNQIEFIVLVQVR